jgi:hypothetical protein
LEAQYPRLQVGHFAAGSFGLQDVYFFMSRIVSSVEQLAAVNLPESRNAARMF